MNPIDFAQSYINNGWSLIPILPDTKKPPIKWSEFQDRKATLAKVTEWIDKGWYLAVVTGDISGVLVIDDDRVKHGLTEWGFDAPVISQSASGGKHYYFLYDREIHSHINPELHIDLKAWHSYCLLPPFNERKWIKKPSQNLNKLAPIPDEFVRLINSNLKTSADGIREPLEMADFVSIKDGARTDSLYRIACSMFSKLDKDNALRVLAGVNQTYSPPLNKQEFDYQVSRACEFVKKPSLKVDLQESQPTPAVYYSQLNDFTNLNIRPTLKTGSEKIDKVFNFPSGNYVIIANPGAGKGWFALWLARQFYLINDIKTVYFSLEMSEASIRARLLQAWSNLTEDQIKSGYSTFKAQELMRKDVVVISVFGQEDQAYQTPENFEKDFEEFYHQGYRAFCFDHLHELMGSNNNDTNQGVTEKWSKTFQAICKRHEDVWLFIYAQPNGNAAQKKVIRREDIAGSKAITQKADCVISLNRTIEIDQETKQIKIDSDNREVIFWIDKNRHGTADKIGAKLYFSKTGNFVDRSDEYTTHSQLIRQSNPTPVPDAHLTPMEKTLLQNGIKFDDTNVYLDL